VIKKCTRLDNTYSTVISEVEALLESGKYQQMTEHLFEASEKAMQKSLTSHAMKLRKLDPLPEQVKKLKEQMSAHETRLRLLFGKDLERNNGTPQPFGSSGGRFD